MKEDLDGLVREADARLLFDDPTTAAVGVGVGAGAGGVLSYEAEYEEEEYEELSVLEDPTEAPED